MAKRFYKIYVEKSTGRQVILNNDTGINVAQISLSNSNQYTIKHNLNRTNILCLVTDSDNEPIFVDQIKIVDINTIEIMCSTIEVINVTVIA